MKKGRDFILIVYLIGDPTDDSEIFFYCLGTILAISHVFASLRNSFFCHCKKLKFDL